MEAGSVRVRAYAILVAAAAGIVFALALAAERGAVGQAPLLLTGFLLVAATVAQRFPVHLSEKTKVYVDAAIFVAAALLLPPPVAMLVAATAVLVDELLLGSSWRQVLFNVSQTALYVGAGALTYEALNAAGLPPTVPGLGSVVAVVAAVALMHLLNTGLVAGMVALQLRRNAYRTWREGIVLDLPQHLALVAIGLALAVVADAYPWLAPLFVAPLAFVYLSLRRHLELRQATRETLLAAVDLVELAHQLPAGHSRRVARLARQVAERLGLGPDEAEGVETAAQLHHLGDLVKRIGAGGENDDWPSERASGVAPLNLPPLYTANLIVLRHLTERWDGTGLPDRLSGEAIPLPARVIAVADAFDRLVAVPGGTGADLEDAVGALRAEASRAWDPRVVEELIVVARGELPLAGRAAPSRRAATA
jgi:hypothetical protein